MLLDIILEINKMKLDDMILSNEGYRTIIIQSQKLDKYVVDKFKLINQL